MRIVPPTFRPWEVPVVRRHKPARVRGGKGYQAYRACLRWDFGFACPFCFCHEVDVAKQGVVGSGQFEIEHFRTQKDHPSLVNAYGNCYWVCRLCNRARRAKPHVDGLGRALLDPCSSAWKDYFTIDNDEVAILRPNDDASYTMECYKPNEPKKVRLRRLRRMTIEDALPATEREFWALHDELLAGC